jgi:hypothetical protein
MNRLASIHKDGLPATAGCRPRLGRLARLSQCGICGSTSGGEEAPGHPSDPESPLLFIELPPPTDLDIAYLLRDIASRVLGVSRRFGLPELTLRALERELGLRPQQGDPSDDDLLDDDLLDGDLLDDDLFNDASDDDPIRELDPQQALLEQTIACASRPCDRP